MGRQQTSFLPYFSSRQAPCVRQPGAWRKEACPGQYLPGGMGQCASAPAAGGLRTSGSLLGSAVREGSHDGELPSRRMAGAGRAGQGRARSPAALQPTGQELGVGPRLPGACSVAWSAPRPRRGPPRWMQSMWVPLGSHSIYTPGRLQFGVYSSLVTEGVAGASGQCSPPLGQQGLELGLGSHSQAPCCRQLLQGMYFWPLGQGRACSGRHAPGLAGAEGYFWLWLLTRQAALGQSLPL